MITKKHPIDFETLHKDSWIETEELEDATLCKREDIQFQQRVLGLKTQIELRTGILSRIEGQRLRLMTDDEAVIWVVKQAGDANRKLQRASVRIKENINCELLSATGQAIHEHAGRVISEMAIAQAATMKKNSKLFALMSNNKTAELEEDVD
jgi:hypothetical protein